MAVAVALLPESLWAVWARERSSSCVFAEVIAQVATFLEVLVAVVCLTLEKHLPRSGDFVAEFNALVPISRNARKRFRRKLADVSGVYPFVGNDANFV